MAQNAALIAGPGYLRDRLDNPRFVVRPHQGAQGDIWSQRRKEFLERNAAAWLRSNSEHSRSKRFELVERRQNCRMFDLRGHDMSSGFFPAGEKCAFEREGIGLRSGAGEAHF